MTIRERLRYIAHYHMTKVLGFAQVTIGVFALNAEELFGKHGAKWVLIVSGLLTAWRGFFVSNQLEKGTFNEHPDTPDAGTARAASGSQGSD